MITYQTESLSECIEEIKPLIEGHWEEVAVSKDKILLNPDYARYKEMDSLGLIHTVTVRDGEELIGYYVSFLYPNLHYKDHLYAVNDILYLHPSYRKNGVALNMLFFAEEELKKLGVSVITLHMKVDYPFHELCEAMGMKKIEYIYSKYIGD